MGKLTASVADKKQADVRKAKGEDESDDGKPHDEPLGVPLVAHGVASCLAVLCGEPVVTVSPASIRVEVKAGCGDRGLIEPKITIQLHSWLYYNSSLLS